MEYLYIYICIYIYSPVFVGNDFGLRCLDKAMYPFGPYGQVDATRAASPGVWSLEDMSFGLPWLKIVNGSWLGTSTSNGCFSQEMIYETEMFNGIPTAFEWYSGCLSIFVYQFTTAMIYSCFWLVLAEDSTYTVLFATDGGVCAKLCNAMPMK